jgi:hypothetical protein
MVRVGALLIVGLREGYLEGAKEIDGLAVAGARTGAEGARVGVRVGVKVGEGVGDEVTVGFLDGREVVVGATVGFLEEGATV